MVSTEVGLRDGMKPRLSRIVAAVCVPLLAGAWPTFSGAACTGSEQVRTAALPAALVTSAAPLRTLEPHYFGFNFTWVEFQESLWDEKRRRFDEHAVKWLQAFPGAVYRYPGGTESNHFDWKAAVGSRELREPRKIVKWKGPLVATFGFDEYLAFVTEVGGQSWYVANLFGDYDKETDPKKLADDAYELAAYLKARPDASAAVLRWELGNELDRGEYLWPAKKYLDVSKRVAEAIRSADPQARFVAIMEDYDAHWRWHSPGATAEKYNRQVAAGLSSLATEYAQHSYYDGVNVEVPYAVSRRIAQICKSIDAAESAHAGAGPVGIWVTEHARQPVKPGESPNWKPNWPRSADLEAALGVADFMIAASQIPEVMGLFMHALHGLDAPWPMFHKNRTALPRTHPSAVFWALHVLREGMEADVFATTSHSGNTGGYMGGYDFRASVMANPERTKWSVWSVNRAPKAQTIALRIPALAGKSAKASLRVLADDNLNANNYADGNRLRPRDLPEQVLVFDKAGRAALALPAQSVAAARLDLL